MNASSKITDAFTLIALMRLASASRKVSAAMVDLGKAASVTVEEKS
jgi:hypothetical protein